MDKLLFDKAVEEFAASLRLSPPPYPPLLSAVSAVSALLVETFPDSSPARVLWDVYQAARQRVGGEAEQAEVI